MTCGLLTGLDPSRRPASLFELRMASQGEGLRCKFASQPKSTHASSPRVLSGFRARRSSISIAFLMSPKGRAEHRAFHRARGATWVNHVAAVCERHTAKGSSLGRSSTPAFRTRMDFAACSMSQEASLPPSLPVRASCRPDMHLGRPPVLPASVPSSSVRRNAPDSIPRVRHRGGHRIPLSTPRRRPQRAP